jgi:predicted Rossmann-fold nucleotide-binding protein
MHDKEKYISAEDFNLLRLVDSPQEVVKEVLHFYSRNALQPNF